MDNENLNNEKLNNKNLDSEIADKLTKVCICKGISKATIKKAVKNGALTLQDVQKATGAGSGPCQGRRCTPKILKLLEENLSENE